MGMTKKIEIDGKEVAFKASAAIPRIYRIKFHRDIYKDLRELEKAVGKNSEEESIPKKLKAVLEQLHDRAEKEDDDHEIHGE